MKRFIIFFSLIPLTLNASLPAAAPRVIAVVTALIRDKASMVRTFTFSQETSDSVTHAITPSETTKSFLPYCEKMKLSPHEYLITMKLMALTQHTAQLHCLLNKTTTSKNLTVSDTADFIDTISFNTSHEKVVTFQGDNDTVTVKLNVSNEKAS